MRHIDARDDLQDGIENAELPPMGPDGAPQLSPNDDLPPDPPRLCAAGPCRHYHTFKIQMDAANPMNPERDGHSFHTNIHHYCYPSPGVETNLGSLPVLQCSRWAPETVLEGGVFARGELALRKVLVRRAYEADLRAFCQHRDAVASDLAEATRVPEPDEQLGVHVLVIVAGFQQDVSLTVTADETMRGLVTRALGAATDIPSDAVGEPAIVEQWFGDAEHGDYYEPIDNPDATFAQLSIRHGARLRVSLKTPETKENE